MFGTAGSHALPESNLLLLSASKRSERIRGETKNNYNNPGNKSLNTMPKDLQRKTDRSVIEVRRLPLKKLALRQSLSDAMMYMTETLCYQA